MRYLLLSQWNPTVLFFLFSPSPRDRQSGFHSVTSPSEYFMNRDLSHSGPAVAAGVAAAQVQHGYPITARSKVPRLQQQHASAAAMPIQKRWFP